MNNNQNVRIGDLVKRPKLNGIIEHEGAIVGHNAVLQNTPEKGEHLATLEEFSAGQQIKIQHTGANPIEVQIRAQKILANPKKYHAIFRNCQHTASEAILGVAKSGALFVAFLIGVGVLCFVAVRKKA